MRCSPSVLVPAAARRAPPIPCVTRPAATRAGRRRSPRAATLARPVPRASRRPRRCCSPRGRAAAALAHSQCRAPRRAPEAAASAAEASTKRLAHAARRAPRGSRLALAGSSWGRGVGAGRVWAGTGGRMRVGPVDLDARLAGCRMDSTRVE